MGDRTAVWWVLWLSLPELRSTKASNWSIGRSGKKRYARLPSPYLARAESA